MKKLKKRNFSKYRITKINIFNTFLNELINYRAKIVKKSY